MSSKPQGLPKTARIKKRKEVDLLFTAGKRLNATNLRGQWLLVEDALNQNKLQVGVSVPKKLFKKATDRNRIKRLLRESWRLQKADLEDTIAPGRRLIVFLIFTGSELPSFTFVFQEVSVMLQKLRNSVSSL